MIEEFRRILDKAMINNDVYVVELVLAYLYPKCERCNELFPEDKTYETWDGNYVCIYCYTKFIYKRCYTCKKMYHQIDNAYCRSCLGSCRVYCSICLDVEYRRGFMPTRLLTIPQPQSLPIAIIDDIIHTAMGLANDNNDSDEDSDLDID